MEPNETRNDEQLAALLQLAGPRPAIDPNVTRRVRSTVRDVWQQELRGGQRRRTTAWVIGLAAALLLVILYRPARHTPLAPPQVVADVQVVQGTASVRVGSEVLNGSTISTSPGSVATLHWRGHGSLRIAADSRVRFVGNDAVRVDRGALYYASDATRAPITVHTRFGEVRDVGTQFEVRVDRGGLRVRVREGIVELQRKGNRERADAGIELTASDKGVERARVPTTGADWNWVLAAAPPMKLDGNARVVLAAIAREKGLSLLFIDRELAERVSRTSLHDNVPLTPDEALDAATTAANLTYRVTGRTLTIDRRGN